MVELHLVNLPMLNAISAYFPKMMGLVLVNVRGEENSRGLTHNTSPNTNNSN